jgi:hypothetical protein
MFRLILNLELTKSFLNFEKIISVALLYYYQGSGNYSICCTCYNFPFHWKKSAVYMPFV